MTDTGRRLSIDEAAQLIYHTRQPTQVQLDKVRLKLLKGILRGNSRGSWVASESVAAYMAARVVTGQANLQGKNSAEQGNTEGINRAGPSAMSDRRQSRELSRTYRSSLRDYFAAVIRRRRPEHATAAFDRAVLIGQIAFVVVPLLFAVISYSRLTAPPPERAAVKQWIAKNHKEYQVVEWFPPHPQADGAGSSIRVKYRYFTKFRKAIVTERTFIVRDGHAALDASSDG